MKDLCISITMLSMLLLPMFLIALIVKAIRKRPIKGLRNACLITVGAFVISTLLGITITHEHVWKDATCELPRACEECGETEGEALGHKWNEATCLKPQTCTVCQATQDAALGHAPGEWIADEIDYSKTAYWLRKTCTRCNAQVDTDIKFFDTMHEDGRFLFSPEEFTEKLDSFYSVMKNGMTTKLAVLDDDTLGCGIIYKGECIAVIMFNDDNSLMEGTEKNSHTMSSMLVTYYTEEVSEVVDSMYGIMFACSPSLEESDAKILAKNIVYAAAENDYYEYKGVKYALSIIKNKYRFAVSVLKK